MDSGNTKTITYLLILFAVVALFGMAIMKFVNASTPDVDTRTRAEKLNDLEKAPGVTTQQGRNFIKNEQERQQATKDVEKDAYGAPGR